MPKLSFRELVFTRMFKKNYKDHISVCHQIVKEKTNEYQKIFNYGVFFFKKGRYESAINLFQSALESKDYPNLFASVSENLGRCYSSLGDYDTSIQYHKASLTIQKEIKSRSGEATSLENLGNCYNSLGEYETSIQYHKYSLKMQKDLKEKLFEMAQHSSLAMFT